jgi:hypothetical protein
LNGEPPGRATAVPASSTMSTSASPALTNAMDRAVVTID